MAKKSGMTKKEQLQWEIGQAVGAGKEVAMETVDFSDPNRPKTCLEVNFPIPPINELAKVESSSGAGRKPIYTMSKWWARRPSSVFRAILIAAATKAPNDPSYAGKIVWENYYSNHKNKGAFRNLKVADIFMGGGTTLVEGSRLGMQMFGNDLNPVAWFVVKQELAQVDIEEVKRLLADIEAEVKPQIMPYFYCDGPNGEKGTWTHKPSGRTEGPDFDPLSIPRDQRKDYKYEGPEIIYTFWAKHGPCQVTGCGHRTPIMSSPVMAIKTLSVKKWDHICPNCGKSYDLEDCSARMAPDVPLFVAPTEASYAAVNKRGHVTCPHCQKEEQNVVAKLGKGASKKIELSLLVHPDWLAGSPSVDSEGKPFGGSAQDNAESTARWNQERANKIRLLEIRGKLPDQVTCPETGVTFAPEVGTVPKKSHFACGADGAVQDVLDSVKATKKTGPIAGYGIQGYAPKSAERGDSYNGRFFAPFTQRTATQYNAAIQEWEEQKDTELSAYWPRSEVPFGFMTSMNNGGIPNHGFTHWWTMFNPRQLLVHALLLKATTTYGKYSESTREYVLCSILRYLQHQNMMCFWDIQQDCVAPSLSNANFHPKSNLVENSIFSQLGRGNWNSSIKTLFETKEWVEKPWDLVSTQRLSTDFPRFQGQLAGKTEKVSMNDTISGKQEISCLSSTELDVVTNSTVDLVITDPPFGGLLHYSELSDFFYVWLRLVLKNKYPKMFSSEYTPKSLEVVANRAREPKDADGFYQRLLAQCWKEAHRILKPSGILTFTFHHSEDEPWVAVLESLFEAGFYLEATYPIRSDETKGEGAKPGTFGSQTIEYDIIHVCRKRTIVPTEVSWGRMRREVLADVRNLQSMLEMHAKEGLPAADLQVIRRGKALEYFSRHYGKVFVDDEKPISVRDALIGINQLIDEDTNKTSDPPPLNAEPMTRQFLRIFDGKREVQRDQLQKFLKGSITTPDEFEARNWCTQKDKVYYLIDPLQYALSWKGKERTKLTSDLDQALFMVGACVEGSGINANDTLRNGNFKPHIALKNLLEWVSKHLPDQNHREAARRASTILKSWIDNNRPNKGQMDLFGDDAL